MITNVQNVAELTADASEQQLTPLTLLIYRSSLTSIANAIDMHIVIASLDGTVAYCSAEEECHYHSNTLPVAFVNTVVKQNYIRASGTLGGFFADRQSIVAAPIVAENGVTFGIAVIACPPSGVGTMVDDVRLMFLVIAEIVLVITFVVIFFTTRTLVHPLNEMSAAARKLAQGQFDVQVRVSGDDEVAELAASFNNMAASLKSLEEMRSSFIANVSHDLRTPMTVIAGFIDGILDGAIPPEKEHEYLETVRSEILRLSRLVQDLLELSKLESGQKKQEYTSFDLCETCARILLGHEKTIETKHIQVEYTCSHDVIQVYGDLDALYRVVYNLLDNAVKFTNDGGTLSLKLETRGKKAYVSVRNTGQGIRPEDIDHVFERFYQGDKVRGGSSRGTGLGLYIVKTILDQHGEQIWVQSEAGKWCEFIFTLALAAKPDKPDKPEQKRLAE